MIAIGTQAGTVHVWDAVKHAVRTNWDAHTPVHSLDFLGDDELIVTGGPTIVVWNASNGEPLWQVATAVGPLRSLSYCMPTGTLAYADGEEVVRSFDVQDLRRRLNDLGLGLPGSPLAGPPRSEAPARSSIDPSAVWKNLPEKMLGLEGPAAAEWVLAEALNRRPDDLDLWLASGLHRFSKGDLRSVSSISARCSPATPAAGEPGSSGAAFARHSIAGTKLSPTSTPRSRTTPTIPSPGCSGVVASCSAASPFWHSPTSAPSGSAQGPSVSFITIGGGPCWEPDAGA